VEVFITFTLYVDISLEGNSSAAVLVCSRILCWMYERANDSAHYFKTFEIIKIFMKTVYMIWKNCYITGVIYRVLHVTHIKI